MAAAYLAPNAFRRLKTATSWRVVPLWPQLETILRDYLNRRTAAEALQGAPASPLLFPAARRRDGQPRKRAMLWDFRKALAQLSGRLGWARGELGTRMFRHTYCSARLQTLDRGHPVSVFTVSRELGHGSEAMVRQVYGHLGEVRHRTDVVEYRVDAFPQLADRVAELRSLTVSPTVLDLLVAKSLQGD